MLLSCLQQTSAAYEEVGVGCPISSSGSGCSDLTTSCFTPAWKRYQTLDGCAAECPEGYPNTNMGFSRDPFQGGCVCWSGSVEITGVASGTGCSYPGQTLYKYLPPATPNPTKSPTASPSKSPTSSPVTAPTTPGCYPAFSSSKTYSAGEKISATRQVTTTTSCSPTGSSGCPSNGQKTTTTTVKENYECTNAVRCSQAGYEPTSQHGGQAWSREAECDVSRHYYIG